MKKFLLYFLLLFILPNANAKNYIHPEGKYITVNGAKLWVETMGSGEPLFLLAGGPGDSHLYMHSFDALKDSFLLVFIDAFGRGRSDTAANIKEYSIQRDVEDIEGIRKALGIEKINLLGHSYGSIPAQVYALQYGQHLNHLIIADGFYSGKMWQENDDNCNRELAEQAPEAWKQLMAMRKKGLISSDPVHHDFYLNAFDAGLVYMYCPGNGNNFPSDTAYPNNFNSNIYYQLVGSDGDFKVKGDIGKFDVTKKLKDLRMPVLILAGRYDRVAVPKFAVRYKTYCPQATFVMFERGGHNPQVEDPEKVFAVIRSFLNP